MFARRNYSECLRDLYGQLPASRWPNSSDQQQHGPVLTSGDQLRRRRDDDVCVARSETGRTEQYAIPHLHQRHFSISGCGGSEPCRDRGLWDGASGGNATEARHPVGLRARYSWLGSNPGRVHAPQRHQNFGHSRPARARVCAID